ncbi:peptidase S8/S53 domain-containing protein [Phycomyces nitens]|nr:peptidase S8/S53 domain-containing protein [Phycomyces nitens]
MLYRLLALAFVLFNFTFVYAENVAPIVAQLNDTDTYIVVFRPRVSKSAIKSHILRAQQHLVINNVPDNSTLKTGKMHKSVQTLGYSAIGEFRWYAGRFESQPFEDLMSNSITLRQQKTTVKEQDDDEEESDVVHYWAKDVQFSLQEFIQLDVPNWGLDRIDQRTGTNGQYRLPTTQGEGATVYVLDTGILASHNDFKGRVTIGATIVGDAEDPSDANGHGTFVAGVCCGTSYGVAKKANIVSVKTLDDQGNGRLSDLLKGLEWVLSHHLINNNTKSIVNLSLGAMRSQATNDAVEQAIAMGLHFTIAAGNYGEDACLYSPGSARGAITVGAIDEDDSVAYYSNFGKCVDIFAPGTNIRSTWNTGVQDTHVLTGTSMAAPFVAGAMALHLSQKDYSPEALVNHIKHTSSLITQDFTIINDPDNFNENKTVLDNSTDDGYRAQEAEKYTKDATLVNILYTHPGDGKKLWILAQERSAGFSLSPLALPSLLFTVASIAIIL